MPENMSVDRKIEMIIRAVAGFMVLLSLFLYLVVDPWWLLLAGFVGFNLLQSSFTGFCLLESILKRIKGTQEK